jgi:DNA-binding IclR family transcriptional regulator
MAGNTSRSGASVAARTLALVTAFDAQHPRQSLTDLAKRADLPVPTAHRLLGELRQAGILTRGPDGTYAVGRKLWDIGLLAPVETDLRDVASPFLHDLYAATLATVHLAVRDGRSALYLDRLAGKKSVPVVSRVGSRLPLHATGVGKVLLAHAPDDVQARLLATLEQVTPYTVTQPRRLAQQLDKVRREDCATTVEEMTLGACSVAVPIRSGEEVVAALGVVVPNLSRDKARLVSALTVAARGIGRQLQARPLPPVRGDSISASVPSSRVAP